MKVAFYKSIHPGLAGVYSHGVRIITKSIYSHCELIFSNGISASSSFVDGGVRMKVIDYDPKDWDIIDLEGRFDETTAMQWFRDHDGQRYDVLGNVHFVLSVVGDDKNKWFCSEAVGAALGLGNSWRFDPGTLHAALKFIAEQPVLKLQFDSPSLIKI